ncbi:MAG: S9 family peptidase, partial [Sphingomonadaceae bacterium]|nr:S9 family peptidase [Sphingomonadaceae bacterium]
MPLRALLAATSLVALATPALAQESPSVPQTAAAMTASSLPAPPVAERRPHSFTMHGITVEDPYFWMKDQSYPTVDDPDVLAYLNAENAYFRAVMAPHQALIDTLYNEMRGRLVENESTVPVPYRGFEYWTEYQPGQDYRRHMRRAVGGGEAQLLLDENALAEGHAQFDLGTAQVSPDGRYLAYSTDTEGAERYVLRVRDLTTMTDLPDAIPGTLGGIAWSADSRTILYGLVNANWRVDTIKRHTLGEDVAADATVYHEQDDGFQVGLDTTQSERFITLSAADNVTNEVYLIPADNPAAAPALISPRETNRLYSVEERDGALYIATNDKHVNFRLVTAPVASPSEWTELRTGSDDFYITGLTTFQDFYVVEGRERGLDQVEIVRYASDQGGGAPVRVTFPEASYDAGLGPVADFDVDAIRIDYESMVTPETDYSYDIASAALTTLKVQEIPSGYDASHYVTERLMIEARDGTHVPVSLVHRRDVTVGPETPVHLYAYGAYGYAIPPGFSTRQLSLIDRGFIFAIAHIRGGDDLGYQWYLDGKLERRTNSFNDFVDVARGLIARGYSSPGRIAASGGSAG